MKGRLLRLDGRFEDVKKAGRLDWYRVVVKRQNSNSIERLGEVRIGAYTAHHGSGLTHLAPRNVERWSFEDPRAVLDELDPLIEGRAGDHVERDVGVAVVDAF